MPMPNAIKPPMPTAAEPRTGKHPSICWMLCTTVDSSSLRMSGTGSSCECGSAMLYLIWRADVRHAAQRRHVHAVQEDRLLGMAGGEELGVLDAEVAVLRVDVDDAHVLQGEIDEQLELRVAAAPFDVAMAAVGVQVRAGADVDRQALVVEVGELGELLPGRGQRFREQADVFERGQLVGGDAFLPPLTGEARWVDMIAVHLQRV